MKCGNAVLQWFNGKAFRQGSRREARLEWRLSGFERQWYRGRDKKRLHSLEGNIWSEWKREGDRGGEVISPPEHIHFTVFSSNLPPDVTSLPLLAIIPPFAIIYVAKSLQLHTYLSCLCTRTANRDCRLPMTTIRGSQSFCAAGCRCYTV